MNMTKEIKSQLYLSSEYAKYHKNGNVTQYAIFGSFNERVVISFFERGAMRVVVYNLTHRNMRGSIWAYRYEQVATFKVTVKY